MAELSSLNVLMSGGRKSLQQINTSLDDDSILDIISSSQRKRLHFQMQEPDSPEMEKPPKRKKKLVRIFANHQRNSSKSRESRRNRDNNHRNHTHFHKQTQSAHAVAYNNSRSKSMPRIKTETTTDANTPSVPKRTRRFAAWFDKLNPVETPSRSEIHSFKDLVRQSSMKIITNISSAAEMNGITSPTFTDKTDYSSIANDSPVTVTSGNNHGRYMHQKILWRPKLKAIYRDKQLFQSLVAFMERIYCEENIFFLQEVQQYKHKIDQYIDTDEKQYQIEDTLSEKIKRDIDFQIVSIYNEYIVSNAQYQVNLSYECFNNALARRAAIADLGLHQKREIFDIAVTEIERLIKTSVLSSFYDSAEFAVVATQRPQPRPKMHGKSSPVLKGKKSRNPFMRLRASSKKLKYDDEEIGSNEGLEVILQDHNQEESVSYSDGINVPEPYAHSMPISNPKAGSSQSLHDHSETPQKLYNSYEADFVFPKRTESDKFHTYKNPNRKRGDSTSRYSYKSSYVVTPVPVSALRENNNINNHRDRPPSPQSLSTNSQNSRLSLTLSQSHTKSDYEFAYCNVNGTKNKKHAISPRIRSKDHKKSARHNSTKSEPKLPKDKTINGAKVLRLKGDESVKSSSHKKKYKSANIKAVKRKEKEKEKRQRKRRKMKRKKKKKKKKQQAADDANFMCKRKKHIGMIKFKDAKFKKRRKSNNDSDILMKLYREPRNKHNKDVSAHNTATNVDIV